MWIKRINFQNFRNLKSFDLKIGQGFVVLAGPNGAGKTNFLEGLYFGLALRRFPPSQPNQLFNTQEKFFHLVVEFFSGEETTQEVFWEAREGHVRQQLKIGKQVTTRSQFGRQTPVVSFLPEDLNLLTHSPAGRRRFLDETLVSSSFEYHHSLSQYNKVLKQRNLALEQKSGMEIWDEQLAEYGSQISRERKKILEFVNIELASTLGSISPDLKNFTINYKMSGHIEKEAFVAMLKVNHEKDARMLATSLGPHRDDFEMSDNQHKIVGYVSRGQLRAITLTLKILERKYLERIIKISPILLLDDVFSEFDAKHQRDLLEFLKTFEQVFLTTSHLEEIQQFLPRNSQIYLVKDGVLITPSPHEERYGVRP